MVRPSRDRSSNGISHTVLYQCHGLSTTQSASTEKKFVVMLEMDVVIMQRKPRDAEASLIC